MPAGAGQAVVISEVGVKGLSCFLRRSHNGWRRATVSMPLISSSASSCRAQAVDRRAKGTLFAG
jgi:hypothetical protein